MNNNLHRQERYRDLQALLQAGLLEKAQTNCERELALDPDCPYLRYFRSILQRTSLQHALNWANDYEAGLTCGTRQLFVTPRGKKWAGPPAFEERLLVVGEEGLGDFVRHLGHIERLASYCTHISIVAPQKIHKTLKMSFPAVQVLSAKDVMPAGSAWVPSGSLDGYFWNPHQAKQRSGYLIADDTVEASQPVQRSKTAIRVGICTQSNKRGPDRNRNYTTLSALSPIFRSPKFLAHILEYSLDITDVEKAKLLFHHKPVVYHDVDIYNDIHDLSLIIRALDLVISTSTFIADFSAALGVKTIRFHSEFGQHAPAVPSDRLPAFGNNPWYGDATMLVTRNADTQCWDTFFDYLSQKLDVLF